MNCFWTLPIAISLLAGLAGCSSEDGASPGPDLSSSTVLDLDDVKTNPTAYEWFDFRPNVKKLILSGAAETEHIAILWYTVADGSVGLHYHSKTESVYVIDGNQTDGKGTYEAGAVYFNPPGSGHAITDSSGFFVLAYASPPDFAGTDLIGEYTPVRVDTDDPELTNLYPFELIEPGVRTFAPPLDTAGGMSAEFIELTSTADYPYQGNYLLVLSGSCDIEGVALGEDRLVVAKTIAPQPYTVAATRNSSCLVLAVSFTETTAL